LFSAQTWHAKLVMYAAFLLIFSGIGTMIMKFRQWKIFQHPVLQVILLWNVSYLIAYGLILNPPGYQWYYTPLSIGMAILACLPIEALYRILANNRRFADYAVFFVVSALAISLVLPVTMLSGDISKKFETYKLAAEWLNANTEEGTSVGANEIGILRYFYAKGPVIDALGLVTPGVAEHVKNRDYSWYIHYYKPDYLLFDTPHRPIFESMVEAKWFNQDYHLRTTITTPRKSVAIYQRQNES